MGILTKEVVVNLTGKMIQYYKDKGYDAKHRTPLIVKVEDLPKCSFQKIDVVCDECFELITTNYHGYLVTCSSFGKYLCPKCAKQLAIKHGSETVMQKYGVKNISQISEFQEKKKLTFNEKYGVNYPMQCKEVKERQQKTIEEKYGVINASQLDIIKKRKKETTYLHFGVENPLQSEEIKQRIVSTNLERYGVLNPMQNPEIRSKANKTFWKNGTQKTSFQQIYLNSIYNGELNYPIKYYSIDICLLEEKLAIEYDGGGHNLRVTLGLLTREEFDQKEIIRNNFIKREGYKQMRIISTKDLLPSDDILLQMLEYTRKYFSDYPKHSWIEFNIDTSTVRNAEQKVGVFYNYGKLGKIKKSDIQKDEDLKIIYRV